MILKLSGRTVQIYPLPPQIYLHVLKQNWID